MVTDCLCVCGGLDDVSISAITSLTDMIISEKLIWKDIEDSGMAQGFFLFRLEMFNRHDSYTMVGTLGDEGVVKVMVEWIGGNFKKTGCSPMPSLYWNFPVFLFPQWGHRLLYQPMCILNYYKL